MKTSLNWCLKYKEPVCCWWLQIEGEILVCLKCVYILIMSRNKCSLDTSGNKYELPSAIPLVSCCFGSINNLKSSIALGVSHQIYAGLGDELSPRDWGHPGSWSIAVPWVSLICPVLFNVRASVLAVAAVLTHVTFVLSLHVFVFLGEEFPLLIYMPSNRDSIAV